MTSGTIDDVNVDWQSTEYKEEKLDSIQRQ